MNTKAQSGTISARLEEVQHAIKQGRAYVEGFHGVRKVTIYRHDTGWCITNNGNWMDQKSFLITLDDLKIKSEYPWDVCPEHNTNKASERGYSFELRGDEFLSIPESQWIEARRRYMDSKT